MINPLSDRQAVPQNSFEATISYPPRDWQTAAFIVRPVTCPDGSGSAIKGKPAASPEWD